MIVVVVVGQRRMQASYYSLQRRNKHTATAAVVRMAGLCGVASLLGDSEVLLGTS